MTGTIEIVMQYFQRRVSTSDRGVSETLSAQFVDLRILLRVVAILMMS